MKKMLSLLPSLSCAVLIATGGLGDVVLPERAR
jgi:hypothetical protein